VPNSVIDNSQRRSWSAWGAVGLTIGGLGAAFAVAACCALPMLLAGVGLGSAWLFGIARFAAPHRLAFLVMAAVLLVAGTGTVALGRQMSDACATARCHHPAVRSLLVVGLIGGLALLVLGYRYA
jgi:mercuric ion transport protein